ncbi:MAG: ribonuclease E/G [Lachnospiraceae bacterium]|nr:ribonuclease E/G [Lachnospiraceae bacterium]
MNKGKILYLRYKQRLLGLLIQNGRLLSVGVYDEDAVSLVGNIYIGKVQRIIKNIQAAFVEIGNNQLAFLPLSELKDPLVLNREFDGNLRGGDELVVQVARDGIKNKQPSLTTNLSIAGNYLAISRENSHLGVSVKLPEKKRKELISFLIKHGLCSPERECVQPEKEVWGHYGMVVRTNAGNLDDLTPLLKEWEDLTKQLFKICKEASYRTCFTCLHKKEEPFIADLKDYNTEEYDEIVTDCPDIYRVLVQERENLPAHPCIRLYEDDYPLAKLYSVSTLLQSAIEERVWLRSGAYLVIEPTEALTAIDVNTGKYDAGINSEDTFFRINKEAAEEVARQLRLRNLSGIILVDFINMKDPVHNRELLNYLKTFTARDSIRTDVVDMTPLGLVEITRKRVNRPLRVLLADNKGVNS